MSVTTVSRAPKYRYEYNGTVGTSETTMVTAAKLIREHMIESGKGALTDISIRTMLTPDYTVPNTHVVYRLVRFPASQSQTVHTVTFTDNR